MNDKKIVHEEQADWVSVAEQQKQLAKMEGAFVDEERNATLMIGKRLGRKEMIQSLTKLLTVSDLLDLNNIKESKAFKGYRHIDEGGKLLIISTWDDYCRIVEGRSRQVIDNDLLSLNILGSELFDSLRSIGIGSGIMRDIRALPADDQVIIAEVAKTDDKNALMDIVHEMSLKHERDKKKLQQDKADLEKRLADAKADAEALNKVNADTATQCAELKKELHKKQHYLKEFSLDEQATQLRHELDDCVLAIDQQLRSQLKDGFEQLSQYARQTDTDHSTYMAAALVQLQRTIYRLREEFHLPDSVDDDLTPYWQRQLNGHE